MTYDIDPPPSLLMGSMVEQDNPVAAPWLFTQDLSLHLGREPTASYDSQSHGLSESLAAIIGALWLVFVSKVFVALSELLFSDHGRMEQTVQQEVPFQTDGYRILLLRESSTSCNNRTATEHEDYWTDEPPSFVSPMLGTAWDSLRAANELETIRTATRRPVPILRVRNGGNNRKPIWPGSYIDLKASDGVLM
ncbi:hypothetical protein K438DRAFT_1783102 [Mycena galopus ATCC 62051]|nr:hypothetical protein K438DRAFT_1783102 [Mycena galopus ATCC 62051]